MAIDEAAFLDTLRSTFREEAPQKLRVIRRALFVCFKEGHGAERACVLRELHNLKGISRIAALPAINALSEALEALLKNCNFPPPKSVYDIAMEGLQLIEDLVPHNDDPEQKSTDLCQRLSSLGRTEVHEGGS